jgi:hypothetical protein
MNPSHTPIIPTSDRLRWSGFLQVLAVICGAAAMLGLTRSAIFLGFSYLLAFMFFLSIGLGALFLVMLHHLCDAGWSVPVRRFLEHLACLLFVMALLFVPLALLAPSVYPWMNPAAPDHALTTKTAYLNKPFFYLRAVIYFALWAGLAYRLRYLSLKQDETGAANCTLKMRRCSIIGMFLYAFTVTLAAIDWMKSLQPRWFSTMYGLYYFTGSVWVTLATAYFIAVLLDRAGPMHGMIRQRQLHDLGVMLFAFTMLYAYIHFSQYLIIWNANLPDETFWYALREKGSWRHVGYLLVFGHFLAPFLALLRSDAKLFLPLMIPLCVWAWLMHFVDMSFNIMPVLHPEGFTVHWLDLACLGFLLSILTLCFIQSLARYPAFPLKDPRLSEALVTQEVSPPAIAESLHENER